jgi:hypothetical protein
MPHRPRANASPGVGQPHPKRLPAAACDGRQSVDDDGFERPLTALAAGLGRGERLPTESAGLLEVGAGKPRCAVAVAVVAADRQAQNVLPGKQSDEQLADVAPVFCFIVCHNNTLCNVVAVPCGVEAQNPSGRTYKAPRSQPTTPRRRPRTRAPQAGCPAVGRPSGRGPHRWRATPASLDSCCGLSRVVPRSSTVGLGHRPGVSPGLKLWCCHNGSL